MNELMKVNYENDRPTVLARELHDFLEVKTAFKDWFPRMCEYGFSEGIDYCSFLSNTSAKGIFKNMGVTSLSLPYDVSTKTSLEIPITLKEVQTTAAKTVTIPSEYGRGGDTGTTAGTASTTPYGSSGGVSSTVVGNNSSTSDSLSGGGKSSTAYQIATGMFGKEGLESGVENLVGLWGGVK